MRKRYLASAVALLVAAALLSVGVARAGEKGANPLLDPSSDQLNQPAPELFKGRFETSAGDFVIEVHRDWAPRGAQRFYNLVKNGFFDDCRFFRVISGFMAQIGINGDPEISKAWREARILDDDVRQSNKRGFVSFATAGPNTRTTQIFINYRDNSTLDRQGFAPFGQVIEGMEVVDKLYAGYGEGAPSGNGPSQMLIHQKGNAYLEKDFPKLDFVKHAVILTPEPKK